ncbi:fibronectin type III domain-containing protein [Chryseobacterium bernardetii]|uniref:fibronectin type III domain-containing protein n=1 Tax=Chryseobacterium bernardetii TaxID=1241978 RepID=UPI003AF70A7A
MINKIKKYFQRYRSKRQKLTAHSMRLLTLLLLTAYSLLPVAVKSQQYPVKLVPVVIPPYSLKIGDYATSTDNKLQLQVLMTDLLEPQHQTGIKFSLEAGLNAVPLARSNDFVVGMNPFTLYPGNNVTLTNVDLRSLFELQNLSGINAVQYSKPLSDGVYQFCFQAYDYFTKNNLSAKTCATVFMVQYDPPMLTLPQNAEKVQVLSPYSGGAGIVFQWMPRQIASNTKYIFTLKELWDQGQSPISGFLSAPPLWREETYVPTLYYGIDKTQLMPGKRYAWQVQAKSGNPVLGANPTDDNGVYKNNGLSEIFYFDYVENCAVPTLLMAKNVGRGRVELQWSIAGQPAGLYNVQYRKKGSTAEWVSQQSYQASAILTGLEDKTEYEYRIGSVCGNTQTFNNTNPFENGNSGGNAYSYSGIQYFTTDANDVDNNYQCGIMPAIDIANKNPYQAILTPYEIFMAGDFPVTILEISGGNGNYSGTGWIEVPYLANTRLKVTFNNIKLNTDKKLIEGVIETTYDPTESNVISIGGILNDLGNLYKEISDAINDAIGNGGMTQAEWEKLYDNIGSYTGQNNQDTSDLYEQGLIDPDLKKEIEDLQEKIKNELNNLNCTKEETKAKGSNEDFRFDPDCVKNLKDLAADLEKLKALNAEKDKMRCIWSIGEQESLKGKAFYFQQNTTGKVLHKLKSGDYPISFNSLGNVYSFMSNGKIYYPEAGTGKYTTKDVKSYYTFENGGTAIPVQVTENVEDKVTIDGHEAIAMKDCSSKDKGKGLGKGTLYTKNVEGRYKVTVTENNGKFSSKFELTGESNVGLSESDKTKIQNQVQTLMDEKLKELGGLNNKTSQTVSTSTEDGGEFFVKQMNGKQWLETLEDLGANVWENATMPEDYWNKDKNYSKSNIHIPPTFAGVGDGVIGEVTDYPQLIKLGYDVSTKKEVRDGLWKAVKNINLESIKTAATGAIKTKWDAYANSPGHITYHEIGKDGVTVVSMAMGAGFFKKGADGLKDGVEDTGEKFVKKELDTFEDFLTSGGKVKKAGNKSSLFNSFDDNSKVPSKYMKDEQRFNSLASDPDQGGAIKTSTRREAMTGLEAERQGIANNLERGPKGIEFYDSNKIPWDVKTPYGGQYFNANQSGEAIRRELMDSKTIDGVVHPAGKFIDPVTGQAKFKKILLDCTYISDTELETLRTWLKSQSGLSQEQLNRLVEINVNLQ